MRLIFFGSPAFALPSLDALCKAGHQVGLVVTQPDRPAGRGQKSTPPAVAAYAKQHALPVWQTSSLKGADAEARLRAVGAEAMALAAFAALVPTSILELTPVGILNVHPSLLPRWRGAAPIQAALLAGDQVTGVSIIRLVQAMDAGPILLQEQVAVDADEDYLDLEPRLAELGARLLVRALAEHPSPRQQDEAHATYSHRISRSDAWIDWSNSAETIHNQVRALRGWPQAFTTYAGRQLKILRARRVAGQAAGQGVVGLRDAALVVGTADGWLQLDELQLEGRRAQSAAEFLRGHPSLVGTVLGARPKVNKVNEVLEPRS